MSIVRPDEWNQSGQTGSLRTPPQNADAERALLGAILLNNRSFDIVADYLMPEHFSDPVNGRIFAAIRILLDSDAPANPVTLKVPLERDELVNSAGGIRYLAGLANSVVTVTNAGDYGRLIHDLWMRRECIDIGEQFVELSFSAHLDETADTIIETVEQRLFDLTAGSEKDRGLAALGEAADESLKSIEAAMRRDGAIAGVTTGLRDIDAKLAGLHPTDLIILAGRPSMGKTALATNIAFNAARYFQTTDREDHRGKFVAFFSLEMSKKQLADRVLSSVARVDSHRMREGRISQDEMDRLVRARVDVDSVPLRIDDTPAPSVSAIRTRARRLARKMRRHVAAGEESALGLIVIDYLQLIAAKRDDGGKIENRTQEVSTITRQLKALAKRLNVPVLALSQLSRAVEQREDKRPQLSDLRESGTIEADADEVMFVFREQYYLERSEPQRKTEENEERFLERYNRWEDRCDASHNVAEVIVAKNRHGPAATVKLHFDPPYTTFSDLDEIHAETQHGDPRPAPPPITEAPSAPVQNEFVL